YLPTYTLPLVLLCESRGIRRMRSCWNRLKAANGLRATLFSAPIPKWLCVGAECRLSSNAKAKLKSIPEWQLNGCEIIFAVAHSHDGPDSRPSRVVLLVTSATMLRSGLNQRFVQI